MAFCEAPNYSNATHLSKSDETGSRPTSGSDVTQLLKRWRKGSPDAESALMERVQGELRRLAAGYLRHERGGRTLQPTAVVNEAYIRLLPQRGVSWENRAHFFGIAAKMMRRVLVDHARRKRAIKRDAGPGDPVSISGVPSPAREADPVDVLALHTALSDLADLDKRQAEIVEMRFFAGLTVEEIAEVLEISPATVKREWATAKLWLRRQMQGL
jgi:RNA polymerase sigma factor (TIGR02999 family)